jgi:exopolysaccharide biosynthesis predicted pyruvyltransferase EpsI
VPPISARTIYCIPQLILNDFLLKKSLAQFKGENIFNCFRVDPESATESLPEKNLDLSEMLRYKSYPRFVCDWITRSFVLTLDRFENINTDRLHVGIVGGLLGKTTRLYRGSYYKNKAVFEFSIRNQLKTVSFSQALVCDY